MTDSKPNVFVEGGRQGGKAKNPNKGFGSNRERARKAGQIGAAKRWELYWLKKAKENKHDA